MKILYAFLNISKSTTSPVENIIKPNINDDISLSDVVLINPFNTYDKDNQLLHYIGKIIRPKGTTVSNFRNCALNHAKNNGYDWCFIIDDYISVNDMSIYKNYVELAIKYDYGLVMNGYGYKHPNGQNNIVYNNPNPALRVWFSESKSIILNRFPCESFMLFKVTKNMTMFDERLKSLYLPNLLKKMVDNKSIPINGFNLDLEHSWTMIDCEACDYLDSIHNSPKNFQDDMKIIGEKIEFSNDADKILNYINDRNK